ncbi:MAG TPA: cysteine hydrolase family protein [Holophagaceae bacterium]|nr:cysteine hydrolase family protein [Holophagaceae bacterium]
MDPQTPQPRTLLELAGVALPPARLSEAVLVLIDVQREYRDGAVPITGVEASLAEIRTLLARARALGTPVVHVQHVNRPGAALFDPERSFVQPPPSLEPRPGESVVPKRFINAFRDTELQAVLDRLDRKQLVIVGYGTHMCVSSAAREASERGFQVTVVASATGSRDLPDGLGGVVPAAWMHRANLAALGDRFAAIVPDAAALED